MVGGISGDQATETGQEQAGSARLESLRGVKQFTGAWKSHGNTEGSFHHQLTAFSKFNFSNLIKSVEDL